MRRLLFDQITLEELRSLAEIHQVGLRRKPWEDLARAELTAAEEEVVARISADLRRYQPSLVNEATVFARSIYPLLVLAETEGVQALADVGIRAQVGDVELAGTADGAMGRAIDGELRAPFLLLVEAKRGVEGASPVAQLYAEMFAAALTNARECGLATTTLYGCYTIADDWTFVQLTAEGLDSPRPTLTIVTSSELNEKVEAGTIARILKSIVAEHQRGAL